MNRRVLAIAAAGCVAALALWYVAMWSPKGDQISEAKNRQQAAADQVQQLSLKLAKLQDAQRRAPELLATRDRLRSALPETPDLAQFLLDTNDAAVQAQVDFLTISPTPPAAPTAVGMPTGIVVSLTVQGGYTETLDFLDRLSGLRRIVILDSVTVGSETDDTGVPFLNVAITGRLFTTELPAGVTTTTVAPAAGTTPTSAPSNAVAAPATSGGGS